MVSLRNNRGATLAEWNVILDFCWNRAGFRELRELSITRISAVEGWTAITKIEMGHKYLVRQWVLNGLWTLVVAPQLPPLQDLRALGFDTVMNFLYLRDEVMRRCAKCGHQVSCSGSCDNNYRREKKNRCELKDVETHFTDELARIESSLDGKKLNRTNVLRPDLH